MHEQRTGRALPVRIALALGLFGATQLVSGHGTMEVPISRVLSCFKEGPESPKSAACQAAVAASGGPQFLYDWSGVNQLPNGDHKAFVKDGQLCSASKSNYAGLDLARTDWPSSNIAPDANGNFEFIFNAPAPHQTRDWVFYVTNDTWNPTTPLNWSHLDQFCKLGNVPVTADKRYKMSCQLPKKTGKQIIYVTWQRSDSAEAFYSCSDVNFSGGVSTYKELGQLRAQQNLAEKSVVSFRLFDSAGSDLENVQLTAGFDAQTGADTTQMDIWPYFLAQKVNAASRYVSIGVLQSNGSVVPVQSAQENRVYSRNGADFVYRVDIAAPSGTTPAPTAKPTATPAPTVAPTATPAPTAVPTASPKPTATPVSTAKPTATPVVTVKPTATPVVTVAPTAAPTATPAGSTCVTAWESGKVYANPGNKVSYKGRNFENKWWTTNEAPDVNSQWGVWKDLGVCK
ncbi:lytic polysaccharide monooxygenase [Chitinibacter sp. GC72]|uniref:lytic polysaccharide monooxygenase n=1 Tax=Chitinibacter sp. GC72 TaxID=1526917 RepID=UPI0018E03991|nr:lytic polysaccharide monooxygenase [Chitinibacter sp. GC72]